MGDQQSSSTSQFDVSTFTRSPGQQVVPVLFSHDSSSTNTNTRLSSTSLNNLKQSDPSMMNLTTSSSFNSMDCEDQSSSLPSTNISTSTNSTLNKCFFDIVPSEKQLPIPLLPSSSSTSMMECDDILTNTNALYGYKGNNNSSSGLYQGTTIPPANILLDPKNITLNKYSPSSKLLSHSLSIPPHHYHQSLLAPILLDSSLVNSSTESSSNNSSSAASASNSTATVTSVSNNANATEMYSLYEQFFNNVANN